ncbi:lipid-A-disaccharide synthase [bacterium]|nr:lipid-A-disaccharide synthase [bacterium]
MAEDKKKFLVALTAIDPSADMQGAVLVKALREINPNIEFVGIGGPQMASAGVDLWLKTINSAVIGPGEVIVHLPVYILNYWKIRNKLLEVRPDLTILIDSPAVNMRFAGVLRRHGLNSVYYFPPSAWSKSEKRLRDIFGRTDRVICVFERNAESYRCLGMDVDYWGHPMNDMPELNYTPEEARKRLGVEGEILALLPGSRQAEIDNLLPVFLKTVEILHAERPSLQVLIPCATEDLSEKIRSLVPQSCDYIRLVAGQSHWVMLASRAALMSSGTASLEAMMFNLPMVLCYRFGLFNAILGKFLLATGILKVDHIGAPSLILDRRITPEFIQEEVTPENLVPAVRQYLDDTPERKQILQDLTWARQSMGEPGTVKKIAASVYKLVEKFHQERESKNIDVVITSNSPGEVSTWVKHTVTALKERCTSDRLRVVVALVPCPYASGAEEDVAKSISGVDIVLTPRETVKLAFLGKLEKYTPNHFGVVVFLGGDLAHAAILSCRLHYKSIAYAERHNILLPFFTRLCSGNLDLQNSLVKDGYKNVDYVGNLCVDGVNECVKTFKHERSGKCVGIFPGSRFLHVKVSLGVFLRVAARIKSLMPQTRFLISVSPFVSQFKLKSALLRPFSMGLPTAKGYIKDKDTLQVECEDELEGSAGRSFEVEIFWGEPYRAMAEIDMALTIPGTNTGELACCGKPMVVGLSSAAPYPRGGLGGLLDKLPIMESIKKYLRHKSYLRQGFAAQPNRVAQKMVIPEIVVGRDSLVLAEPILEWLKDEDKCLAKGRELSELMGNLNEAGSNIAKTILNVLNLNDE